MKFSFSVTENKSKFEAYDLLINFHYDVRSIDQLIFDNQNSIDPNSVLKANKTESQIHQFIEDFAKDIASILPTKKIKGITDGSYYKYPTLEVDPIDYVQNVWVTYEFKDPNSYFADYNSPLAEYGDTEVSAFKWAPIK
ncbi:hypothetical protein [Paenibacillus sp. FSL R5-0473]|uniref:hypothetical protein n=1 Tax=Paenibacillus sp. FSL R5-0473 TaxID=2921642 RepID=UPI0030F84863